MPCAKTDEIEGRDLNQVLSGDGFKFAVAAGAGAAGGGDG